MAEIINVEDPPASVSMDDIRKALRTEPTVIHIGNIRQTYLRLAKGFRRHIRKRKTDGLALPPISRRVRSGPPPHIRKLMRKANAGKVVVTTVHSGDVIEALRPLISKNAAR